MTNRLMNDRVLLALSVLLVTILGLSSTVPALNFDYRYMRLAFVAVSVAICELSRRVLRAADGEFVEGRASPNSGLWYFLFGGATSGAAVSFFGPPGSTTLLIAGAFSLVVLLASISLVRKRMQHG